MKKCSTSDRLKQIMFERNLKQVDIINLVRPYCEKYKVKMGRNDISQYVSGKYSPRQNKLFVLAKALNVSEAWLMGFDSPMERVDELPQDITPYNPVMHKIPVLGDIAAGLPIFAEQNIIDYMYTELNGGNKYFALHVKGDSMNAASIPDGSTVVVRQQEEVENGQIAAVRVNGENATVKRFKRDKNIVQLIPQSYNPEHEIQIYDLKKDKIDILGKVVECKTVFN